MLMQDVLQHSKRGVCVNIMVQGCPRSLRHRVALFSHAPRKYTRAHKQLLEAQRLNEESKKEDAKASVDRSVAEAYSSARAQFLGVVGSTLGGSGSGAGSSADKPQSVVDYEAKGLVVQCKNANNLQDMVEILIVVSMASAPMKVSCFRQGIGEIIAGWLLS